MSKIGKIGYWLPFCMSCHLKLNALTHKPATPTNTVQVKYLHTTVKLKLKNHRRGQNENWTDIHQGKGNDRDMF